MISDADSVKRLRVKIRNTEPPALFSRKRVFRLRVDDKHIVVKLEVFVRPVDETQLSGVVALGESITCVLPEQVRLFREPHGDHAFSGPQRGQKLLRPQTN